MLKYINSELKTFDDKKMMVDGKGGDKVKCKYS